VAGTLSEEEFEHREMTGLARHVGEVEHGGKLAAGTERFIELHHSTYRQTAVRQPFFPGIRRELAEIVRCGRFNLQMSSFLSRKTDKLVEYLPALPHLV
jgi:hypothetical protein